MTDQPSSVPPTPAATDIPRHLHALLAARTISGSRLRAEVSPDWLQGRTTFGGLIAVLGVQAMRDVAGAAWPAEVGLRALQTTFVGPVGAGTVEVDVTLLREGKNVRQVQATVSQDGQLAAVLIGIFGTPRETSLPPLVPQRPAPLRGADALPALPFIPGVTPNFTQHIDFRWSEGALPFSGGEPWHSSIHMRLHDGPPCDLPHLQELLTVLLADAAPTPVLGRLKKMGPASSVSWALEVRPLPAAGASAGWWRVDKEALAAADGYVNERALLWAPDGSLAAYGYQVVAVYA
jgi:acyl-CoA thioesterase